MREVRTAFRRFWPLTRGDRKRLAVIVACVIVGRTRFVLRLRAKVFRHVQDMPPHFFQKHRQGDLVERLTGDVEAIEEMVVSGVVGTVAAAFSALFYSAAALYLRWDLPLATFLLAPLFLLAARRFASRIRTASQEERVADGGITSVVEESLGNVVLTQAYNRRRAERSCSTARRGRG